VEAFVGDPEPYSVFVRRHADALFKTAFMLTGSAVDAEELLQDTLAQLYPRWDRVLAATSPVAYVRRCLANRLVSVRRRPSSREVSLSVLEDRVTGPDVADVVADRDQMWQLLAGLSARQRAALVLRYLYDMPDE
jgi:RNA polymerase sigma factor (sigma-70 family)